jgi:hypothetical protein
MLSLEIAGDQTSQRDLFQMGDKGLEHIQKSTQKQATLPPGGAESGAVLPPAPAPLPPSLMEIIAGWSRLSGAVQDAILAIIRARC